MCNASCIMRWYTNGFSANIPTTLSRLSKKKTELTDEINESHRSKRTHQNQFIQIALARAATIVFYPRHFGFVPKKNSSAFRVMDISWNGTPNNIEEVHHLQMICIAFVWTIRLQMQMNQRNMVFSFLQRRQRSCYAIHSSLWDKREHV